MTRRTFRLDSNVDTVISGIRRMDRGITEAIRQSLDEAIVDAHRELSGDWPSVLREERAAGVAAGGKVVRGGLSPQERSRRELLATTVAHAKSHEAKHSHGGNRAYRRKNKVVVPKRAAFLASVPKKKSAAVQSRDPLMTIVTMGDEKVCPVCEEMEGITYTLEEAQEIIPIHINCRCAVVPAQDKRFNAVVPDDPAEVIARFLTRRLGANMRAATGSA